MKAFIPAAGMGSRLKPWTDFHPKALVPVKGIPMIERIICKLQTVGISDFTVNTFHFADQIADFIESKGWNVKISDERPVLLETGGGILKAAPLLEGTDPILVHNADILSNLDIHALERFHNEQGNDVSLLVSRRDSSRKLIFDAAMNLCGWHSLKDNRFIPEEVERVNGFTELAFSGIYVISPAVLEVMKQQNWSGKFSIIDFLLSNVGTLKIKGYNDPNLRILDIGKPDSLNRADEFINLLEQ